MPVSFGGYSFSFRVLTEQNSYEPLDFQIASPGEDLVASTTRLGYGEGSGVVEGEFVVRFGLSSEGTITWQASARHFENIKGLWASIESFSTGTVLLPFEEITLKEGDPGRCFIFPGGYYPTRHISSTDTLPSSGPVRDWAAPLVFFQNGAGWLALSCREYPPRLQKIWIYRHHERQVIHLYTEGNASQRKTSFDAPTWTLEKSNDWQTVVSDRALWMKQAYGIAPFAERRSTMPWLKDIGLVAILHGMSHDGKICHTFADMAGVLHQLAQCFPPGRLLVKLVGFEGHIDRHWPDAIPSRLLGGWEGFTNLVDQAHKLGCRLMPHLNVWGASFENPLTNLFLQYQIFDAEGRPSTWSFDYDQDEIAEEIMAYISPASPEWRAVQMENIGRLVAAGVDAIYLDQTGTFINDLRHDHFAGLQALYADLYAAFPSTQFAGEAPNHEVTASLVPLVCGISTVQTERLAEMYRILFGSVIRQYGYNLPPQPFRGVWGAPLHVCENWSRERFLLYEERSERVHGIPTLNLTDRRIDLGCDLVAHVLDRARSYTMVTA